MVRYHSEVTKITGLNSVNTRIMSNEGLRQDFDRCVTLCKDFVKQSSADNRQLLGIAESSSNNARKNKGVTFAPRDQYYDSNEWYALSKSDKDKVLKACISRNGGNTASKSVVYSKSGGGSNNGQGKWKSNIVMLENKGRNKKR